MKLQKKEKEFKNKRFNKINEKRKIKNNDKDINHINYKNLKDLKLNENDYISKIFKSDLKCNLVNLVSKSLINDNRNKKKISKYSIQIIDIIFSFIIINFFNFFLSLT